MHELCIFIFLTSAKSSRSINTLKTIYLCEKLFGIEFWFIVNHANSIKREGLMENSEM